jgi:hypothetical protein
MSRFQITSILMFVILTVGLISTWYFQTRNINHLRHEISLIKNQPSNSPQSNSIASAASQLSTFQSSLDTLTQRLNRIENIPTPTPLITNKSTSASFQKQVFTLGSANTTSLAWSPTGLEITINSADYPASVMAYFEAGLNCAGGVAWARITNKTTGAIINVSEVSHNTNHVTWKRSAGFKLHPGNNSYVVELRSSSGEMVYLSSSRIVIEKQ